MRSAIAKHASLNPLESITTYGSLNLEAGRSASSGVFCALAWITLALGVLVQAFIHQAYPTISSDNVLIPVSILALMFMWLHVVSRFRGSLRIVLTAAIAIRYGLLLLNTFGQDYLLLPGVGTDTEVFHQFAITLAESPFSADDIRYGGSYTVYLGILYRLVGPAYYFASFINMMAAIQTVLVMAQTLAEDSLKVPPTVYVRCIAILALLPNSMVLCSSLRRESLIVFFVALSLKHIVLWSSGKGYMHAALAALFVLVGSALHAGIIGLLVAYALIILLYDPETGTWSVKRNLLFLIPALAVFLAIALIQYGDVFLDKITVDEVDDIYERMERSAGGAAYLTDLQVNSFGDFIRYLPLKMLYFVASPTPWMFRGVADIAAFLLDTTIYLFLIWKSAKCLTMRKTHPLLFLLGISLIICLVIFSIGSVNSANAMRHRLKLLPILVLLYAGASGAGGKKKGES